MTNGDSIELENTKIKKPNKFKEYLKKQNWVTVTAIIVAMVIVGLLVLYSVLLCFAYLFAWINTEYAKSFDYIGSRYEAELDEDGYWIFNLEEDESNFKIMQLTDIHIGGGFTSAIRDRQDLETIYDLVNYSKPDLIIITGDMIFPVPLWTGTIDNITTTRMVISLFEAMGVPYAVTLGNHDSESYNFLNRDEIAAMYEDEDLNYSLFQRQSGGGEDVYGEGNYVIKILNTDGTINNALILMDSNDYPKDEGGALESVYDVIHDDQIEWYKTEVSKLDGASSLAFFHIPLPEYETAWNLYQDGSDEVTYYFGMLGDSGVYAGYKNTGLFDIMCELGSTKGIFCGHDHLNNFSIEYKGIRLTYGLSIDRLAYLTIWASNWQRGGTLITINKNDSSFNVNQVIAAGIS